MRRILTKLMCVFLAMVMLNIPSFALSLKGSSGITQSEMKAVTEFSDAEIYSAFAALTQLDQYLQANTTQSYADVAKENSSMLNGVSSSSSLPLPGAASSEKALGIPSFLWGCAFGLLGVIFVYIMTDNNKDEAKKAFYGCLTWTAIWIIYYVAVIGVASSN